MKLSVSLVLTTAAALNEDLRLEIVADALDIVAYVVAVFLRREPSSHPFPRVNTQPIALNTRLAFILAVLSTIRDLKALFEEQVGLRLARARVSLKKVLVMNSREERGVCAHVQRTRCAHGDP